MLLAAGAERRARPSSEAHDADRRGRRRAARRRSPRTSRCATWRVALRLPLLIAARPGLGTINHTLLTLQAARACGLDVRAVVITPWPEQPSRLERSNLETIRRFGFVEVETLARAAAAELDELARVGGALPWRRWLGERARFASPPERRRAGGLRGGPPAGYG